VSSLRLSLLLPSLSSFESSLRFPILPNFIAHPLPSIASESIHQFIRLPFAICPGSSARSRRQGHLHPHPVHVLCSLLSLLSLPQALTNTSIERTCTSITPLPSALPSPASKASDSSSNYFPDSPKNLSPTIGHRLTKPSPMIGGLSRSIKHCMSTLHMRS
jgi:hypothetical protein